jgi:hypothetical protein
MSKVALTLAERLAQIRNIPNHMLPSTLKHKVLLPKITELKLEANKSAKELGLPPSIDLGSLGHFLEHPRIFKN